MNILKKSSVSMCNAVSQILTLVVDGGSLEKSFSTE